MRDLTKGDYDALFAAMRDDMPRIWREVFASILAQLEGTGALTVNVTDTEITVRGVTTTKMYRVERKRTLH